MIAFPCMLALAAKKAGMKVPEDPDRFVEMKEKFPHFYVFCLLQLGRPQVSPGEHWDNAEVIAKISEKKLKRMTLEDFIAAGFKYRS